MSYFTVLMYYKKLQKVYSLKWCGKSVAVAWSGVFGRSASHNIKLELIENIFINIFKRWFTNFLDLTGMGLHHLEASGYEIIMILNTTPCQINFRFKSCYLFFTWGNFCTIKKKERGLTPEKLKFTEFPWKCHRINFILCDIKSRSGL